MKIKSLSIILFATVFITACSLSKEKPAGIKCKLISNNPVILPVSGISTNFAVLDVYYYLYKKPHSTISSTIRDDYEKIIYLPKDIKASINGRNYFLGIKKRYKSALGKKFLYKPQSIIIGKPKDIKEGKESVITEDTEELIEKYRTLSSGCKVYLFPKFKDYLKILEFPDKDLSLRTYNVSKIRIREMYLNTNDSVVLKAEIKGDSLLLIY